MKISKKVLVRISWNSVCKSEIASWYTFDQQISKIFNILKYESKVSLKGLKSDYTAKKWI